VSLNRQHSSALYYLGLIAEKNGKHDEAMGMVAALNILDHTTASDLKMAMGIADKVD
jgi:serine protease Do